MAKKHNEGLVSMSDLAEEKKRIEKKMARISIPCSHTNSKGKARFEFIGKGNLVKCKDCGIVFDFGVIDLDDLNRAVKIVKNAINQTKVMSDNPEKEEKVIKTLGELGYNLTEMQELYKRSVHNYKKGGKKKKNKKNNNDFGNYGFNGIDLLGTKKNKTFY